MPFKIINARACEQPTVAMDRLIAQTAPWVNPKVPDCLHGPQSSAPCWLMVAAEK